MTFKKISFFLGLSMVALSIGVYILASQGSTENLAFIDSYEYTEDNIQYSNWIMVPNQASGFVMQFDSADIPQLQVQRFHDKNDESKWENINLDEDLFTGDEDEILASEIFLTTKTKKFRYRIFDKNFQSGEIRWLVGGKNKSSLVSMFNNFITQVIAKSPINIITRQEWGANENFRYADPNAPPIEERKVVKVDAEFLKTYEEELRIAKVDRYETVNGQERELVWPIQYPEKVSKIVIHHTAGDSPCTTSKTSEEIVRAIYQFHAKGWGWGDIGYNYIVDCHGNIYEGRAGDFGAIGAHAGKFNTGTVGIVFLGNLSVDTPSQVSIDTTANLVRFLSEKFNIDPTGEGSIRGKMLPNIIGHRDVGNTNCPGDNLYPKLQEIREKAKNEYSASTDYYGKEYQNKNNVIQGMYNANSFSGNVNDLLMIPNSQIFITLMFKNTGENSWDNKTFLRADGDVRGLSFGEGNSQDSVARLNETLVESGNLGTFTFAIQASSVESYKRYIFDITPVINGEIPLYDSALEYRITVNDSTRGSTSTLENINIETLELNDLENRMYEDISESNPFFQYIIDLKQNEIVSSANKNFRPKDSVKRQEFAKMLSKAAELKNGQEKYTYNDVGINHEFRIFIEHLRTNNISSAKENFYPDQFVTRDQAIKMLVNAFKLQGNAKHSFQDVAGIFEPYVNVAFANRIVENKTLFYPKNLLTREQAAKFISLAKNLDSSAQEIYNSYSSFSVEFQELNIPHGSYGPDMRIDVGFHNQEIKLRGENANYDIWAGDKILFGNVNRDYITSIVYNGGIYTVTNIDGMHTTHDVPRFISKDTENGILKITNWERSTEVYNGRQDVAFRDTIEVRFDEAESLLYAINELQLEKYLYGLAEEPDGVPEEKKKTIAVSARSYALHYQVIGGKHPERHIDLISNGNDQVYRGYYYEKDHQQFVDVVKETWGEVVTHNGSVTKAPYFSRSNGKTKKAGEDGNNWNFEKFSYTKSVDDPWSCGGNSNDIGSGLTCDNAWGHGVGISATGAGGMAEEGKTYKEIIDYFFEGVVVEKRY